MAEDPRFARDHAVSLNSLKDERDVFLHDQTFENIRDIARKLASHVGGPASLDLALDLFLHDIVERAREATRATGAAIALARSGEVVCRATTGENAPDLGVKVETTSGLVAACLNTGNIQYCRDAETDLQANREACRQLGVRSMLVIPLGADEIFGLLEVFSSSPNAFGDKEITFLRSLARLVAASIKDVRQRANADPRHDDFLPLARAPESVQQGGDPSDLPEQHYSLQSLTTKAGELWTTLLFAGVIAAAVALGIVVGWSGGAKSRANRTPSKPTTTDLASRQKDQGSRTPADSSLSPKTAIAGPSANVSSSPIPEGGLLVTQNGKVIYRSAGPTSKGQARAGLHQPERRLIHRVEPDYPSVARAQHIEGTIVLDTEILPSGEIGNVVVVSGNSLLADAAVRAVKQWRYEAIPDASQTRINLNFVLPANTGP